MKKRIVVVVLLVVVAGLSGCAAKGGGGLAGAQGPETIKLECNNASRLGCRHRGRMFPWNAWVEAMGYDSKRYAVKEVIPSGNRAKILIVKR